MLLVQHTGCLFLMFTLLATGIKGQECTTPSNKPGQCVPLDQCPYMQNAFRVTPIDENTKTYLKNALCRYRRRTPIVCCESDAGGCTSATKQPGACVPMRRCEPILRFLEKKPFLDEKKVSYMREAKCQYGSSEVTRYCCPIFHNEIPL